MIIINLAFRYIFVYYVGNEIMSDYEDDANEGNELYKHCISD